MSSEETSSAFPWDRPIPAEESGCFEAFTIYRDLENPRSIAEVYRIAPRLGSVATLRKWAQMYAWKERVREYDIDRDRERRNALARARDQRGNLSELRMLLGQQMIQVGEKALREMLGRIEDVRPTDASRLIEHGLALLSYQQRQGDESDSVAMTRLIGDLLRKYVPADILDSLSEQLGND